MYKSILIPLDGSKLAEAVLPAATALAKPTTRLVLLRVMPDLWIDDPLTPEQTEDFLARVRHDGQNYLDSVAEDLRKAGFSVDVMVATGEPADQIIEVATLAHCDLIAMATHGHSGWQRLMLGSVADKVVQHAAVPVLLVRPPQNPDTPLRTIVSAVTGES